MEDYNENRHVRARDAKRIVDRFRNATGIDLHVCFSEYGNAYIVKFNKDSHSLVASSKEVYDHNATSKIGKHGAIVTVFERKELVFM